MYSPLAPMTHETNNSALNIKKRGVINKHLGDILFILLGVLSAGLGLKGFLLPSKFIDGGVTGISLLINQITGLPLYVLIIVINIPFIFIAYRHINQEFAIKTLFAIIGLSLCLIFIPYPIATFDKLLVAVFGGVFLGAGIGLSIRGGCVIDGTEVVALYLSRKSGLSVGDIILIVNVLIFSVAAMVLKLEAALYSMLTYLSASKTVDYIIQGIEEYTGVTIISEKSEEIRKTIINTLERGVTVYKGKRGFGSHGERNEDIDVIFTVVTRLEITRLKAEIERIDEQAFVVMHSINDTKGGMVKKRRLR